MGLTIALKCGICNVEATAIPSAASADAAGGRIFME
jgi:hypothetical protein